MGASKEQCEVTLQVWHKAVEKAKLASTKEKPDVSAMFAEDSLVRHIHPDCEFKSPTFFKPMLGAERAAALLTAVSRVFGPTFHYNRTFVSDDCREWCLFFEAPIRNTDMTIRGVDLVSLDAEGKITCIEVCARPLSAVAALKEQMASEVPLVIGALQKQAKL